MNQQSYVKAVKKRLTCSTTRRDEFVRDLESDIASALAAGESWEQVEQRIGDPFSMAQEFNEALSPTEIAAWKKRKRFKIAGIVAGVVVVLGIILTLATLWVLPQQGSVQQINNLEENPTALKAKEVITLLEADDFESLRSQSTPEMAPVLNAEKFKEVRTSFGDDWGKQESLGNAYITEFSQMGQTGDLVQMTAFYENTTVTYTISFTKDGKLSGIFLK